LATNPSMDGVMKSLNPGVGYGFFVRFCESFVHDGSSGIAIQRARIYGE